MSRLTLGLFGTSRSIEDQATPRADAHAKELRDRMSGLTPVELAAFAAGYDQANVQTAG